MINKLHPEPTEQNDDMILRTVFLPKALDVRLREEASALDVSKGELIRRMISKNLEDAGSGPVAFL